MKKYLIEQSLPKFFTNFVHLRPMTSFAGCSTGGDVVVEFLQISLCLAQIGPLGSPLIDDGPLCAVVEDETVVGGHHPDAVGHGEEGEMRGVGAHHVLAV